MEGDSQAWIKLRSTRYVKYWCAVDCISCGFIGDRDVTAYINIIHRHPRCGGARVSPERPRGDVAPNPVRRNPG